MRDEGLCTEMIRRILPHINIGHIELINDFRDLFSKT